ncbi:acyl transferase domain-containing protein [Saccharothrix ecbatanensis]|uniref:Acyl transferase domain-containing protein n=1 Tax=Saccharothrix ecbatanensis TaxID=1105145 RepID=A0A7W9HHB0_9PSEU|nr:acyltransferase domain-containing protein [Saccharothrix ecbatanensis]MBB5802200.1 acyl transferase domain-containing protein [Saccharothrix ecbatanensis]
MTRRVALLFPGQGSQYPRMAAGLYGSDDVFTSVMDEAFELLGEQGPAIRAAWLDDSHAEHFDDVTRAQPLLYAVDYALGRVVLSWGLEPVAMLGHSVGEMVAATLAEVFTFAEGMELMRDRVKHYADSPPGGMLAVAASVDDVTPFLTGAVAIAAVNAKRQTMLAGGRSELAAVAKALHADGYTCMRVRANQAFHSPMVADAAERTLDGFRSVRLSVPRRTIVSSHLGTVLTPEKALDPVFWAMQPATTVQFWPALDLLLGGEDLFVVEAGPGQGLTTLARLHPAVRSGRSEAVALLPTRAISPRADRDAVRDVAHRIKAESMTATAS